MKVMFIAPMFSGLADGLRQGRWEPRGVPAVTTLFEKISALSDIECRFVFLGDDQVASKSMAVPPLGLVQFLPAMDGSWIARVIGTIRQTLAACDLVRREKPDLVYAYNAAIVPAAIIARFRMAPVMMRFLGIHPFHKAVAERRFGLMRWLFASPFVRAVCSRDGSGGAAILPKLLPSETPLHVRLNGVDTPHVDNESTEGFRNKHNLGKELPIVLFVGRLEYNKGPLEFVAGCAAALKSRPNSFIAVMVGDGSARSAAKEAISASGVSESFRMTGALTRADTVAAYRSATIYVSLNQFGSLSNTNLEALSEGLCMISLALGPDGKDDPETLEVIPADAALRIDRDNLAESLCEALESLLDSPSRIEKYRSAAEDVAATFESWDERVMAELDFIRMSATTAS